MSDDYYLSPIELAIRQAMADGLFDNLPGLGKPLRWNMDEESQIPEDMRMAYKIMRDHEVLPDWMMQGQALDTHHQKIIQELERAHRAYTSALQAADQQGDIGRRSRATRTWDNLLKTFAEAIEQYNKRVLTYNLKVPPHVTKRHFLDLATRIEKLESHR